MAIDWEAKAGAPCVSVFGEPATFTPYDGSGAYQVTGVFDSQFRATAIIEGVEPHISDTLPVFGVNAAQFISPPKQNDMITFPAGSSPHSGKSFLISETRPDSHGIYHLALNEAAA